MNMKEAPVKDYNIDSTYLDFLSMDSYTKIPFLIANNFY